MPTLYEMVLPQPEDSQEFERVTLDALKLKWDSPNLQLNGRPRQKQHGVDIYGADYLGRQVGIQCKHYEGPLSLATVTDEIENAEAFEGQLSALFVATTAPTDSKLQKEVHVISEWRARESKFAVGILFWDDIYSGLALNRTILTNYYPELKIPNSDAAQSPKSALITGLVVGYYGRRLWELIELIFGEFGWMSGQDQNEGRTLLHLVRNNVEHIPDSQSGEIVEWLSLIEREIFATPTKQPDWEKIKHLAKSIANRVKYMPSLMSGQAVGNFVELGMTLGAIYHSDADFTQMQSESVYRQIKSLLPDSDTRLIQRLDELKNRQTYSPSESRL